MHATRRQMLGGGAAALVAAAAPRLAWGRTQADVAIIGCGLAGLSAARVLEGAGFRVVLVEAEERVGGRLHTLADLPGAPEAGGIQVGQGYTILRRIAGELGVGLPGGDGGGAGVRQIAGNLYHINGISVPSADWAQSAANHLQGPLRETEPAALTFALARNLPRLETPEAWLDVPGRMDVSLRQALQGAGASNEALRLIEANLNGNSLAGMSQVHLARTMAIYAAGPGPTMTIAGGSQRLPEAMAANLSATPRLGESVRAIGEEADGVAIYTEREVIRARQCICTIPFAALRNIPMECSISPQLGRMVAELPYTRASFAYIAARTPFWQSDGLPETLWTDDPLIGRVFVLGDDPAMLKLWTTGAGADMLDRLPRAEAARMLVERIEQMRPSAQGQLEIARLFSWQASPNARGIYHLIGTGMVQDLAAATREQGARLHFAGEHMARGSSGMEGALESGERTARLVASRL